MTTDDPPTTKTPIEQAVEHAVDLFVYAPIGILFEGASLLPELIEKGKGHVHAARFIGKYAVGKAGSSATSTTSKLQDQAAGVIDFLGDSLAPLPPTAATTPPVRPAPAARKAAPKAKQSQGPSIDPATLAIPDYDGLSASQVVNRLAGLAPAELEDVQRYEAAHRGRKTILSKIAQLQAR